MYHRKAPMQPRPAAVDGRNDIKKTCRTRSNQNTTLVCRKYKRLLKMRIRYVSSERVNAVISSDDVYGPEKV